MNINLINSYYYSLPWIDIKILSIKKNTVIRIKKKMNLSFLRYTRVKYVVTITTSSLQRAKFLYKTFFHINCVINFPI